MDNLMEKAKKFLDSNYDINEIELSDGVSRVRLMRNSPVMQYYQPQYTPYQYQYHYPQYPYNY